MSGFGTKYVGEDDDFTFGFARWLNGETITSAAVAITGPDSSLAVIGQNMNGPDVIVRLTGGKSGSVYSVDATITTSSGRKLTLPESLLVADR